MQILSSSVSALLGIVLGALLVIRSYRSRTINDDQRIEPTYPPKLGLVEFQTRTGTDPHPNGRGW